MKRNLFLIFLMATMMFLLSACGEMTTVNTDVPNYIKRESSIYSTNLDGISITTYSPGKDSKIVFQNGVEEKITKDYIALFVNGSLLDNAGIFIEDDRVMAPVALVAKNLHLGTEWNVITRKLTVFDGTKIIEVFVDDKKIKVGEELIELEKYPAIYGDRLFASSEFFRKVLGVEVVFYDGVSEQGTKIVPNLRHVMFYRYPEEEPVVTVEEATNYLKEDLILAYENKFSKYEPLAKDAEYDKESEADVIRAGIRDLYVITANDRFYILHAKNDFLVDKYTGELFSLIKGDTIEINHFNPYSENALNLQS